VRILHHLVERKIGKRPPVFLAFSVSQNL
jgi:hypothetical protein